MQTNIEPMQICMPVKGPFDFCNVESLLRDGEIIRSSVRLVGEERVMRGLKIEAAPTRVDALPFAVLSGEINILTGNAPPDADLPHLVLRCNRHFCLLLPLAIDANGLHVAGRVFMLAQGPGDFFYGASYPTPDGHVFGRGAPLELRSDIAGICADLERKLRSLPDAPRALSSDEALAFALRPPLAHGMTRERLDAILRALVTRVLCRAKPLDDKHVARLVTQVSHKIGTRHYAVDLRRGLRRSTDPAAPALCEMIKLVLSHYAPDGFSNDASLFKLGLVCAGISRTVLMHEPSDNLHWTHRAHAPSALELARAHALVHDTIGDIATRDEACAARLAALLQDACSTA